MADETAEEEVLAAPEGEPPADAPDSRLERAAGGPKKSLRHELRTPLNQILGYSEMLQEDAEAMGRLDFVQDLQRIEKAGRTLLELINQVQEPTSVPAEMVPVTVKTKSGPPPSADDGAAPATRREPTGERLRAQRGAGRILVVDDDEQNRDMLSRRLRQRGYDATTASGGVAALELIAERPFDLVLLDVMMPEVSGIEVLDRIRARRDMGELPVIMATARDASEDVVEALGLGANDYVTKPLDFAVVLARIETQLALKHARDQVRDLNAKLQDAQQKIGELVDSSVGAVDDVATWASSVAKEIADAIDADRVGFWLTDPEDLANVTRDEAIAPSDEDLREIALHGRPVARGAETLVPILGHTGELFGIVVVTSIGGALPEASERLVSNFARHLGGALELGRARRDLAAAAERQRVSRQDMMDRGVALLCVCPKCKRCYDHNTDVCPDDGAALGTRHLTPYRISERYRLVQVVGEGGMGTVYRAHDERLEREVAVKLIRSEHFHNENVRMRFEAEARTVAKIDHPGVIAVYDSGELEDRSLFIVMEWLDGCDVANLLSNRGPGTPAEVAEMLRQASRALDAAHRTRLVHRDIKPENIFASFGADQFRFKIVDFGVAKELTRNAQLTETGSVIGTPLYMSPEQLMGNPIDARSDLYSLAVVAFQTLTGRRLVAAQDFARVLLEVVNEPAPRLASVLRDVPELVDEAFAAALSKEPRDRPDTVSQWVDGFVDVLEAMPPVVEGWRSERAGPRSIQVNPTPSLPRPDVQAPTMGAVPMKTTKER